ncbi:MAG: FtsX-like permease family protein [Saprospiraceae bacterium]|nr:FtsX-like permease family protein [Saprospiraceae bacterium]
MGLALVACIGAFGLATYSAEQRRSEIGIRKVLGASTFGLVGLLSRDFLQLVVIAVFLAAPLAWYLIQQWLETYPLPHSHRLVDLCPRRDHCALDRSHHLWSAMYPGSTCESGQRASGGIATPWLWQASFTAPI